MPRVVDANGVVLCEVTCRDIEIARRIVRNEMERVEAMTRKRTYNV